MPEKTIGEKSYEQFADRYAQQTPTKPHNAYYNRPGVLALLPDVTNKRALDAGCGPGTFTEWLLDHGAQVTAFDVTPRMVELVTAKVGTRAERIFQHDLNQPLDFAESESLDLVVCSLVLDYIEDWRPVFREFARVLKPGGAVVASFSSPADDYCIDRMTNYHQTELIGGLWRGFGDPPPYVELYRRPLSAVFNPIIESGLRLDRLLEPLPSPEMQAIDPETYQELMTEPAFLFIRAVKP
ncbi:MAG: class I SAM-dependent methyltransferase [Anaerolineae bacterium]|nr:class I SAM-dependent methyltransferase [Anaerolineae bacterium]